MAFVYKYVDHEGTPVYIGIVKGDFYTNLDSRIGQHFSQDSWRDEQPNCKIFYIEGLTGADADAIETILCAKYHPKHNGAKMNWGPTELGVLEDFFTWHEYTKLSRPKPFTLEVVPQRWQKRCSYCGIARDPLYFCDILYLGDNRKIHTRNLVCDKCRPWVEKLLGVSILTQKVFDVKEE